MFCNQCGRQAIPGDRFCRRCGAIVGGGDPIVVPGTAATEPTHPTETGRRRSRPWGVAAVVLAGMCAVLAALVGTGTLTLGRLGVASDRPQVPAVIAAPTSDDSGGTYTDSGGSGGERGGTTSRQTANAAPAVDPMNATIPAGVCGDGETGWEHDVPIELTGGKGVGEQPDGSFADVSIMESRVLGTADVDSDGSPETVLALQCSGSPPESCCAGRTSLLWFVAAFDAASDELRLKGPVIRGTPATPGDEDGPAFRAIEDARLDGASVVTTERISYAEQYTFDQVGGDPQAPVTVSYRRSGAGWEATVG